MCDAPQGTILDFCTSVRKRASVPNRLRAACVPLSEQSCTLHRQPLPAQAGH